MSIFEFLKGSICFVIFISIIAILIAILIWGFKKFFDAIIESENNDKHVNTILDNLTEQLFELRNSSQINHIVHEESIRRIINNIGSKQRIKVKILDNYDHKYISKVNLPYKATEYSAGFDLYATHVEGAEPDTMMNIEDGVVSILPGTCIKFGTSLVMELPEDTYLDICSRSGLSINKGLAVANSPARIDSDYRGEIIVAIRNLSNNVQTINIGDRIAQCTLHKLIDTEFVEVNYELSKTYRDDGKFGSTGNN